MNPDRFDRLSTFQLEGEFVSWIGKPGKTLKYLCMAVGERQLHIKLAKPLRKTLSLESVRGDKAMPRQGDLLQVLVGNKSDRKTGELKLKAYQIEFLSCQIECGEAFNQSQTCLPTTTTSVTSKCQSPKKGKILLCQKSGCLKRGGKKLHQALEETLRALGLQEWVKIEGTSCQKRCKRAPNMVLMPGKAKYGNLGKADLSALLEEHYLTPITSSESLNSQN